MPFVLEATLSEKGQPSLEEILGSMFLLKRKGIFFSGGIGPSDALDRTNGCYKEPFATSPTKTVNDSTNVYDEVLLLILP